MDAISTIYDFIILLIITEHIPLSRGKKGKLKIFRFALPLGEGGLAKTHKFGTIYPMNIINELKNRVLAGKLLSQDEARALIPAELDELRTAAREIQQYYLNNTFDLCAIINAKSGKCSENCKFCAQSAHYFTHVNEYPLLESDEIYRAAKYNAEKGVNRFSIVTSGRKLNQAEVERLAELFSRLRREVSINLCISCGLLSYEQFTLLKTAGLSRYHNNLETSRRFFPEICTTHTYDDKIAALRSAAAAGLELCSGGIIGLGETMEDRIDLAFQARDLGVVSVPVNVLNAIPGTPLERQARLSPEEVARTVALFRFILPAAAIRLAGGRGLYPDKGKLFMLSGVSAAITGDMLTTSGICIDDDKALIATLLP